MGAGGQGFGGNLAILEGLIVGQGIDLRRFLPFLSAADIVARWYRFSYGSNVQ